MVVMWVEQVDYDMDGGDDVTYSGHLFCGQGTDIGPIQWSVTLPRSATTPQQWRAAVENDANVKAAAFNFDLTGESKLIVGAAT